MKKLKTMVSQLSRNAKLKNIAIILTALHVQGSKNLTSKKEDAQNATE